MPPFPGRPATLPLSAIPARLLDLTRLVSRVGHPVLTGVDRVEHAYMTRLLTGDVPLFGLVATSAGQALLDREGVAALARRLAGTEPWGKPDLIARLSRSLTEARRAAEADVRRLAVAHGIAPRLGSVLRRYLPPGTSYLNTGHSNLSDAAFRGLRAVPGLRIAVLIHDTIPLDYPQFTRPGIAEVFAAKLRRVSARADLVIYNSGQSQRDAERHFSGWGRVPDGLVAHLGVDLPCGDTSAGALPDRPYFVSLGTIEPRKNHTLLLDIWDRFRARLPAAAIPGLQIVGARGWMNAAVFARLDALPPDGPVRERGAIPDAALVPLLRGAAGLLSPSLAEGFGLPLVEAAGLGVPILCNTLAVYREFLGDYPVYANVSDSYLWEKQLLLLAGKQKTVRQMGGVTGKTLALPSWNGHFNLVLSRA